MFRRMFGVAGGLMGIQFVLILRLHLPTDVFTPHERLHDWLTSSKIRTSNKDASSSRQFTATQQQQQKKKNTIRPSRRGPFRPFTGDPQHHNHTIRGESLPGPFFDHKLFLMGARLTTSYLPHVSDVHVDVFGFPGDWISPGSREGWPPQYFCDLETLSNNWTFVRFDHVIRNSVALYCQVECNQDDHILSNIHNDGDHNDNYGCSDPIQMALVPFNTGDPNQERTTLIWRCNVTKYLSKMDIRNEVATASTDEQSAVRIRLWYNNDTSSSLPMSFDTMSDVTEFDIPLHTAVVGHGGPQIRSVDEGFFSSRDEESPMPIGLCMSMYGHNPVQFLPEFVQHHKNMGFQPIVIGVETTLGSYNLSRAEAILRPYIDEGLVLLQATGLRTYFNCTSEIQKLHFYHQCLYHLKGVSKYAGIWDLDEYWLPPNRSMQLEDNRTFTHDYEGYAGMHYRSNSGIKSQTVDQPYDNFFVAGRPSSSSRLMNDPLWQRSNYSTAWSIQDSMEAIEKLYDYNGCDSQRWCFHLYPSYTVLLKEGYNRTGRIVDDFYKRENKSRHMYRKGIIQTRYAMMGGFHIAGSCRYPDDTHHYPYAAEPECLPLILDSGEAGGLHHFHSLVFKRRIDSLKSDWIDDEYLESFAQTVSKQLSRYKMS